ncbi:hypothetical protein J7F01_40370 [Streptomyces sp. ISL-22]|nr:hypothetical protein [Streptomyces sp. ISL-24]MBT2438271.1 hypothetical protein [Streptomyces sp. ISL-22]
MTFILEGRDRLSRVLDRAGDSAKGAEKKLAAFGAAIPAAAAIVPFVGAMAGAGVAVAAFGAAVIPQIGALGEASQAQQKYRDAVEESGAASQAAVDAELAYHRTLAKMPPASREAAASLSVLKDEYREWSDDLAGDTMPVFNKGIQLTNSLLPKTSGLVKGASGELDRLMTIAGGGMATPGFDRFMGKVERFAVGSLRRSVDGIVHLTRVANTGQVGGSVREFLDFARQQGPVVGDTLRNVALAAVHVLTAAGQTGVSLLQVANAAAKVVAALPTGFIAVVLQLALAIKAVTLTRAGLALLAGAFTVVRTQILAASAAAGAATGRVAALRAAFAALSRTARMAMASTGVGLAIVALMELSERSRQAPPDVDKLTDSLRRLGQRGAVTGEASRAFGKDLDGLHGKIRALTDPSTSDKVQQWIVTLGGLGNWDSTPVKNAKANLDAIDKALANLVKSGEADLAAQALKRLTAEYGKGGRDTEKFTQELNDYREAIADAKFESELAAQSQGLFGVQAQKTQRQLAAQKLSADGLRQSIQALSDTSRSAFDAQTRFEAAIDNVTKSLKENGATLNVGTEKGRANRDALSQLASATQEAAAAARENGQSWSSVNGIYARGREQFIKSAQAMGLSRAEAKRLADQILKIPDKTARIRMDKEDAQRDLEAFNAAVRRSPGSKSVTLKTLSKTAEQVLESFGLKVRRLPNGKVKVTASVGSALSGIGSVSAAMSRLQESKRIVLTTEHRTIYTGQGGRGPNAGAATGGLYTGAGFRHRGYSEGGLVDGPGTETSDSVWAGPWLSRNEFVVRAKAVAKYGVAFLRAINEGRLSFGSLTRGAGGGMAGAGAAAASGLAGGMGSGVGQVTAAARRMAAAVVTGIKAELEIASPSKKTAALAKDVGAGFIKGLTGSRDKIKSVAADLAKDIKTAFSGKKESSLLKMVDQQTKKLLDYASKRDKIAAKIAEAKSFASDVTKNAREGAGLSNLGMGAGEVTAGGIKAGLAGKLAQIKQFTRYIGILAKRGLNKGLLRQILNMGPEQGYAYASALVGADKSTFASINKTQAAIDKESKKLGMSGADILYDSGQNAGKGFLKGLEGQKKSIENLMLDIAKGMQAAIRKALGIKSPSTVMAKLGVYSTEGLARGLIDGVPVLDRALSVVTGRVASTQPAFGRATVAGRGGAMVVNVTVQVGPASDPHAVAREVRTMLLNLKRDLGGAELGIA